MPSLRLARAAASSYHANNSMLSIVAGEKEVNERVRRKPRCEHIVTNTNSIAERDDVMLSESEASGSWAGARCFAFAQHDTGLAVEKLTDLVKTKSRPRDTALTTSEVVGSFGG